MTKTAAKPRTRRSPQSRMLNSEIKRIREQAEDLLDLLDALEVRARNLGKPRTSHAAVLKKFGGK